ncbi:TadE-like protein [compost metagenome]
MKRVVLLRRSTQRGAAALEFALVFVLFFALFYGTVSYSLPLLMLQSFNHATAEAVRQALAVDPDTAGFETRARTVAQNVLAQRTAWLPAAFRGFLQTTATFQGGVLSVSLSYDYLNHPLVPTLALPGIGQVPRLPAQLVAAAQIRLD